MNVNQVSSNKIKADHEVTLVLFYTSGGVLSMIGICSIWRVKNGELFLFDAIFEVKIRISYAEFSVHYYF